MKVYIGLRLVVVFLVYIAYTHGQSRPTCPSKCGNVKIEFPFGISPGCYYEQDSSFKLSCNEGEKLIFGKNIEVVDIFHHGQLRVKFNVSFICFKGEGNWKDEIYHNYDLKNIVSLSTKNKFTLVGCNAFALLTALGNRSYTTGCLSYCGKKRPTQHRECRGEGCCKIDVSDSLLGFRTRSSRFENATSSVMKFNPCIYAFLVEQGKFEFSSTEDLQNLRSVKDFPVLLDWSIGTKTCKEVGNNNICRRKNSTCIDSTRGTGYNCECLTGFEGNPYSALGCQDIDECTSTTSIHRHNCSDHKICENKPGTFGCRCQSGYRLDTTTMSCKRKEFPWPLILLGTIIGILVLLVSVNCIQQRLKYQKKTKLRQQFFEQNGGGMLTQRITSGAGQSTHVDVIIFTEAGMKEATNCYDESRILGEGGQGTVFKGILPDNSIVAIKKARLGDRSQVEQFINEVLVLSQINHRNVVKLLGCCLETQVPLLVYNFISNGTLYHHLHGSSSSSLTWQHRMRIAIEVAETLAYLHSSASIPIIHRDVKTANILLDDNLTAKVADFGASRLIPVNKEQLTTVVQGTFGYLDPEYYNTGLLTVKSDVYSFGIVLMELLTGLKPICFERPPHSKLLMSLFSTAVRSNRLHEIIDSQMLNSCNMREVRGTADLALTCTRPTGETRPNMKRVATKLEALRVN